MRTVSFSTELLIFCGDIESSGYITAGGSLNPVEFKDEVDYRNSKAT
jgi:hypothetical protein